MKHSSLFLFQLFCLVFVFSPLSGQDSLLKNIEQISSVDSDEEKIELYHQLLSQTDTEKYQIGQAELYRNIGLCHSNLENDDKAIEFLKKGINAESQVSSGSPKTLNKYRYELAQLYKSLSKLNEQYTLLEEIIEEDQMDSLTCVAYADQAVNIVKRGDYLSAIQLLNSVLADNSLMHNVQNELIIRCKLFYIYAKLYEDNFDAEDDSPDLEILERHQMEVKKKFNRSGLPIKDFYKMYNNLGMVYEAFGKKDLALNYYNKAISHYRETGDTLRTLYALTNICLIHGTENQLREAKSCFQELIDLSSDKEQITTAYTNMGYYLDVDSSKLKIPYYFKGFEILLGKENSSKVEFQLPTLDQIKASNYEQEFLIYLVDLSSILMQSYEESHNQKYLLKAKETLYLIDQLVSIIRYDCLSDQSKLFWIEKGVDTYMLGVKVCFLLNQEKEAFYFMEKNKALLLQENIITLQNKLKHDVPKETLEREYNLFYKRFEQYEAFLNQPEDSELKQTYSKINKEYLTFMDSLYQQFPDYAKTKKQVQILSLDEARDRYVSEDKSFVEYILSDTIGYGLFCAQSGNHLFEIEYNSSLLKNIKSLRNYMTEPILSKAQTKGLQEILYSSFNHLFPFDNALGHLDGKQVTIIADHVLHHIPFEVLSVTDSVSLSNSYLINFTEVSYLPSISVAEQIKQKNNNPSCDFLGVAPKQFFYDDLKDLSASIDAMNSLSQINSSKFLLEEEASKQNFLAEMSAYKIIHLNTHAGIDSINLEPWIAFADEKMNLSELYGKENQAELVILDACKTNDGELALGEGILSLSRGFFHNGTQSVLASKWNVNEQSGNAIINKFYNNLQDGNSKSKALQLAKIDYLKKHQYSEVLPYYWAAYTLTGNTKPVELRRKSNLLGYLGFAALALVLFFLIRILINGSKR